MSYSFTVKKDGDRLVVEHDGVYAAPHLPDGAAITVNGHTPSEGTSQYGSIGVALTVPWPGTEQRQQLASAQGGYNAAPVKAEEPAAAAD